MPIERHSHLVLLSTSVIPTLRSCKSLNFEYHCRHLTGEPEILYRRLNKSSRLTHLTYIQGVCYTNWNNAATTRNVTYRSYLFNFWGYTGQIYRNKNLHKTKTIFRDVSLYCLTLTYNTALPALTNRLHYFKSLVLHTLLTTRPYVLWYLSICFHRIGPRCAKVAYKM
jgi:hypothetical protein